MNQVEMLNKAGLNWNVSSEPIQTQSGLLIPDRIALVREDTQQVLGIHTESYVPYQNHELMELLFTISKHTGLEMHTGGSFKGGEKVFVQLKSNDLKIGNDTIKGYISGLNSFDGKTSLAFGNSSVTISCMNSFFRGYRSIATKIRHSASMHPRIEEYLQRIDSLLKEEKTMFQEIEKLGNVRMTQEVKDLVTKRLFEMSIEERLDNPEHSTNLKNRLARFNFDLDIETKDKGDSLWGLFSGITRYTTHSMKKGDNSENKMFGRTGMIEREIYHELVGMV